jgi:hypothetical protein
VWAIEQLKQLSRELGRVLFPIKDGAIFTDTFRDHDVMYDGMINAFSRAIDRLGEEEQAIEQARAGLAIGVVEAAFWGVFFFGFTAKGLGKPVQYNDTVPGIPMKARLIVSGKDVPPLVSSRCQPLHFLVVFRPCL